MQADPVAFSVGHEGNETIGTYREFILDDVPTRIVRLLRCKRAISIGKLKQCTVATGCAIVHFDQRT